MCILNDRAPAIRSLDRAHLRLPTAAANSGPDHGAISSSKPTRLDPAGLGQFGQSLRGTVEGPRKACCQFVCKDRPLAGSRPHVKKGRQRMQRKASIAPCPPHHRARQIDTAAGGSVMA